jgi:hypothetical protein
VRVFGKVAYSSADIQTGLRLGFCHLTKWSFAPNRIPKWV